jgi:hypothetical protein
MIWGLDEAEYCPSCQSAATPVVGPGSIKEAIENLVEPNLAFEKVANFGRPS